MSTPNRAALIAKLQKVLRKHYKPVEAPAERPVLEQLIYGCCLENAPFDVAETAVKALSTTFFDWNEVRVSTIKELSEVVSMLPDPMHAAVRLRGVLQGIFETTYSFDVDSMRKLNLGQALKKIEKLPGMSHFVLAFATQSALGGHSIPIDRGTLDALWIVGVISDAEKAKHIAPGLERAVPKNKGVEFFTLLHQLGVELFSNPYSTNLHKILLEVTPDAKHRLPKRLTKKQIETQQAAVAAERAARKKAAAEKQALAQAKAEKAAKGAKPAGKPVDPKAGKPAPAAAATPKTVADAKKKPPVEAAKPAPSAKPSLPAKPQAAKPPAPPVKKPALPQAKHSKDVKKSPAAGLAKKKPR